MFFPSIWTDATKTALALYEASVENAKAAQETAARQAELISKMENPWHVKWTKSQMPMPVLTFKSQDMDSAREAFHLLADVNLSAWENLAKAHSAMPGWMKAPYKMPGEFWSKWFDQFQDGKFDAPFAKAPYNVFETMMKAGTKVDAPANETVKPCDTPKADVEEFKLESPSDSASDGSKPMLLKKAKGKPDDLTRIKGIGAKLETTLHELGVFHFSQIAEWTPENIAWIDEKLAFKGRVQREAWVEQAQNILKAAA